MRSIHLLKTYLYFVCISLIFQTCSKPKVENSEALKANDESNISGTIAEGTYKISADSINSSAITLVVQSIDDNVATELKTYLKDSTSYLWHFTKLGNGLYRISNAYSGKVLSEPSNAIKEGQCLVQMRYDTSAKQLW